MLPQANTTNQNFNVPNQQEREKFEEMYKPPPPQQPPNQNQASAKKHHPSEETAFTENESSRGHKKTPSKLPQHLASSVTFGIDDDKEQFYRKNQNSGPQSASSTSGSQSHPTGTNSIREGAQKAYFQSHLENVFDWNQGQNPSQPPQSYPPEIPQRPASTGLPIQPPSQPPQFSQGSQNPNPAQNLVHSVPPKTQMNPQQKHTQIMKLENSLLTFQMDRDRMQAELEKIPDSHRLGHNYQQKREELQREVELLDKNINTVKLKLRDIKH